MFYRYEIRKKGDKRVLYIYLSSTDEESNEFIKEKNFSIEQRILNFIKNNNIDYNEGPVYIISNGIIIKSIDIHNKNINIEELIGADNYNNQNFIVKVEKNNILNIIKLEDFLLSMLLTTGFIDDNELLKCLTILYRTYAYKKMGEKGYITQNDIFIKYKDLSYYKILYYNNYYEKIEKLKNIIKETDCTFITYNDIFIDPYIHLVNNGHTDKKDEVDYLEKVSSLWDLLSPNYITKNIFKKEEIMNIFNTSERDIHNMKITKLTSSGCIDTIKIGDKTYSGKEFMEKLSLPSLDMTIIINDKYINIINRGIGNNLGLSVEGAKYLSNVGCNYLQILNYYFPKCKIKKYSN